LIVLIVLALPGGLAGLFESLLVRRRNGHEHSS
jgi:hypothetical protein